jgi:hypothetical protein
MKTRLEIQVWVALLALAFGAGACGRSNTSGTEGGAGSPGGGAAPSATAASIPWGEDTVWADAKLPAGEKTRSAVALTLAPGGNASMTTDYVGRGIGMDVGWWSVRNDTVAIQFSTIDGKTSGTISTWRVKGAEMTPLVFNKTEWGPEGVPFEVRTGRP